VGTAERDPNAADDGDATSRLITHAAQYKWLRARRYGVVFLQRGGYYNRGMRGLLSGGVVGAALAMGCAASDPEVEIRALLAAAEEAAEARDVGFFGDALGEAYRDARGNDRDEALRTLRGFFIANQRVEVVSRVDEIALEGTDAARAVVHAGLVGQRAGGALLGGVGGDLYRFELELVNDDGEWRIIGAKWSRGLGE
jgi:hypothetical protein